MIKVKEHSEKNGTKVNYKDQTNENRYSLRFDKENEVVDNSCNHQPRNMP